MSATLGAPVGLPHPRTGAGFPSPATPGSGWPGDPAGPATPVARSAADVVADQVLASCRALLTMTRERRARLPFMHPGRVDVIGAGALIWSDVVARVRADVGAAGGDLCTVVTSEHDILDGITLSAAGR